MRGRSRCVHFDLQSVPGIFNTPQCSGHVCIAAGKLDVTACGYLPLPLELDAQSASGLAGVSAALWAALTLCLPSHSIITVPAIPVWYLIIFGAFSNILAVPMSPSSSGHSAPPAPSVSLTFLGFFGTVQLSLMWLDTPIIFSTAW
ncbi:hypothetical protein OG21DRAFT_1520523, partial [Imleria badia]